jgi:hypothetical protein
VPDIIKTIRVMLAADEVARKLEALLEFTDFETLRKIDLALGKHAELVEKWRKRIAKASAKAPKRGVRSGKSNNSGVLADLVKIFIVGHIKEHLLTDSQLVVLSKAAGRTSHTSALTKTWK